MDKNPTYEALDLLIPSLIIKQILRDEWSRDSKEGFTWQDKNCDLTGPDIPQLTLWIDRLVFLNVYDADRSFIPTTNLIANRLGVIITANDPKTNNNTGGTLDPSTRVKYSIMNHIDHNELLWELSQTLTPLENLCRFLGGLPCAQAGPNKFSPTLVRVAIREIASTFICVGPLTKDDTGNISMRELGA